MVGLVIVTEEMQDSVHEQLTNFSFTSPGGVPGLRPGDRWGNDNLSQERDAIDGFTRVLKTQDIGRTIAALRAQPFASSPRGPWCFCTPFLCTRKCGT